jgi:hypothetical protein
MKSHDIEHLMWLLARAKAVWMIPDLLNLAESAENPTQAYDRVLAKTGKRKKALAARWHAVACRDFDADLVGACVRFLRFVPQGQKKLAQFLVSLSTP